MEILISVLLIALVLQFVDAFLGQGYGTMTPLLILLGFAPLQVVFAVLLTSAVLSLAAGFFHHSVKNVDFHFRSKSFKITAVLVLFGLIGMLIGVLIAINLPKLWLETYIAIVVIAMGLFLLKRVKVKRKFSWKKIIGFGSLASFNKGITGGGFGPVLASGQIMSGVSSRKAVPITALVEGVVSSIGVMYYLIAGHGAYFNLSLVSSLLIGGIISTPLAAIALKRFHDHKIKKFVAIASITIGLIILVKLFIL